MNADDYQHLAKALALVIEASMWNIEFAEHVAELEGLEDVLEHRAKDLPLPDAARLRLEILQVLKQADAYADDPRAKEFGTMFCLLDTLSSADRVRLSTMLVELLRFAAEKSAPASAP